MLEQLTPPLLLQLSDVHLPYGDFVAKGDAGGGGVEGARGVGDEGDDGDDEDGHQ